MIKVIKRHFLKVYQIIRKKLNNDNTLYLVYTIGKVGSQTVYYALKKKMPYSYVFHAHFLSNNYLNNILPKLPEHFHNRIDYGKKIIKELKKHRNKRLKIITLTREPISRSISTLFQENSTILGDVKDINVSELKRFIEEDDQKYTLEWFDKEFNDFLDFDIYSKEFNKERGYEIYNFETMDILCIKLERLNDVFQVALKEFTGKQIELELKHSTMKKQGKEKYLYLNDNVKISSEKLKNIYESKYMKHFYTNEEIDTFLENWS